MLIIGLAGKTLDGADRARIRTPQVSGVILFTRNFASRAQVAELCDSLRDACRRPLLIAVDQEGGPVQRFRDGFTRLPASKSIEKSPWPVTGVAPGSAWPSMICSNCEAASVLLRPEST